MNTYTPDHLVLIAAADRRRVRCSPDRFRDMLSIIHTPRRIGFGDTLRRVNGTARYVFTPLTIAIALAFTHHAPRRRNSQHV